MKRKIIHIDEERCDGCGACAHACHEGAIAIIDGKARLIRDDYCDGLGDCLPVCHRSAISFVERDAAPYDEAAVQAHRLANPPGKRKHDKHDKKEKHKHHAGRHGDGPCGCPGSQARLLHPAVDAPVPPHIAGPAEKRPSCLAQWPVQIQLAPVNAPYFDQARLLVAADCAAYAHAGFHEEYMRGRVTLIGCPKLDGVDYAEKLTEILRRNDIKSVTAARMEVPCCGGLENAVKTALQNCGKMIPWQVIIVGTDGSIREV